MIFNSSNDKKVKVPRLVQMHADEMNDIEEARPATSSRSSASIAPPATRSPMARVKYTMTSMFIPNAVISLAIAPKDKAGAGNFSKALNKFTKEDPTFRVHRDEESAQTIICGMGELHLEIYCERIKREYNCEVIVGKPQVAFRETITQARRLSTTPTRSKRVVRASSVRSRVISSRCRPTPSKPTNSSTKSRAASIPREFIPACEKGFLEAIKEGRLIGFPIVGVRVVHQRRRLP